MTFKPPLALRSGHLQTILNGSRLRNTLARQSIQAVNQRAQLQLIDCGEGVRLIGAYNRSPKPLKPASSNQAAQTNPLVVLLHGWEGSFGSTYMLTATNTLLNAGYDVFRLNMRDHGPSLHLNKALFNATLSAEITRGIASITQQHKPSRLFLAGYSLGGNFALRIAADNGCENRYETSYDKPANIRADNTPNTATLNITAALAVCPPLDPAVTMAILEQTWSPYQVYFYNKWRTSLQNKLNYFPELNYGLELARCKGLADINGFFIPEHTPYSTPEDYFAAYAITGKRLEPLTIPALLLTSKDDPIIPYHDLATIEDCDPLQIELLDHGGHCGFLENKRLGSWVERRMVEYFDGFIDD